MLLFLIFAPLKVIFLPMQIEQLYQIYKKANAVSTDSRTVQQNDLFFALSGDRFNGNQFAKAALEKGAGFAVIDDAQHEMKERTILVKDSLQTLQNLASHHRQQFKIPVIGVTGSNGKTTTKDLMARVLSSHYKTHFTQGNFNNHIGVPLTLLAMPEKTEVAIIEMGMNHLKEISELCEIADPTHGLITNIGKAHLEGVGGIQGVKKAKAELYDYLKSKKRLIFVNRDERFLWEELVGDYRKKLGYSSDIDLAANPIYQVELMENRRFVKVQMLDDLGQAIQVHTQLIGEYNFNNIMTAIAIGQYFKVPPKKIKSALENYVPANNRSQWIKRGNNTYILDAYNANPTSMRHVLEYFGQLHAPKKIAILGDMLELGEDSLLEHQMLLEYIEGLDFQQVILVGDQFGQCQSDCLHFETVEQLTKWFQQQAFEATTFLIKGSRGMKLEKLLDT